MMIPLDMLETLEELKDALDYDQVDEDSTSYKLVELLIKGVKNFDTDQRSMVLAPSIIPSAAAYKDSLSNVCKPIDSVLKP